MCVCVLSNQPAKAMNLESNEPTVLLKVEGLNKAKPMKNEVFVSQYHVGCLSCIAANVALAETDVHQHSVSAGAHRK